MIRHLLALAATATLSAAAYSRESTPVPETVNWSIEADQASAREVQFEISWRTANSRSNWSNTTPLAELQGLEPVQLASSEGTPVRFQVVREAGRFDCSGIVRRHHGTGECRFEGDPAFAAALEQRGIGRPDRNQQYHLALARVGLELVDELDRRGYARPRIDDLVGAGIHGVTADYVRALDRSGDDPGSLDRLVAMRIHGVSPEYVGELAELGYRNLSADDLTSMRIHGVTTGFVRDLQGLGYAGLSADDLTSMRIHGVTSDFVRRAVASRTERPTADELVSLRIHGGR